MTDYLFPRPSFLEGMGRNADMFGALNQYNYSRCGLDADLVALRSDRAAVYGDLYRAFKGITCQVAQKKTAV